MAATAREVQSRTDPRRGAQVDARIDLAAVHRLAYRFGFDDGIWNHFTLEVPGVPEIGKRFFVKAHGLLMSEITASNLIVVDGQGNVVDGDGPVERTAFCIHSQIHAIHPNAACVLHAHPDYSTWLADVDGGRLEMTDQDNLRFYGRIAYDDDYQGGAVEASEGARMARAFNDKPILVSRNHGVTVAGPTVAEAFYDLYYLEKACYRQYLLASGGRAAAIVSEEMAKRTAQLIDEEFSESAALHFEALKRVLDREEPDYSK